MTDPAREHIRALLKFVVVQHDKTMWWCDSCGAMAEELDTDPPHRPGCPVSAAIAFLDAPVQPVEGGGDGWGRVRAAIADAIIWRDATAGDWNDVNAGYLDTIFAAYSTAGGNTTSDLRSQLATAKMLSEKYEEDRAQLRKDLNQAERQLAKQSEDMADIRRAVLEEAVKYHDAEANHAYAMCWANDHYVAGNANERHRVHKRAAQHFRSLIDPKSGEG